LYSLNDDHSDDDVNDNVFGHHSNRSSKKLKQSNNNNRRSKDSRQIISVNMQSNEDINDLVGSSSKHLSNDKHSRLFSEAFMPIKVEQIGNVSGDNSGSNDSNGAQ